MEDKKEKFIFNPENFVDPKLPSNLKALRIPIVEATEESLKGYGHILNSPDDFSVQKGNFEISKWPQPGWRVLDPGTGDEAGTNEGNFEVHWHGDFFYGKNLAISTKNNTYLDGLAVKPEIATHDLDLCNKDSRHIYLWMSDYHPDGAQMFWPLTPIPFVACLGLSSYGDDIRPEHMRAFYVPQGKGVYFHPSTWHNGVYVLKEHAPATFLTRQGKVHARISVNWAHEFNIILKVPLFLSEST